MLSRVTNRRKTKNLKKVLSREPKVRLSRESHLKGKRNLQLFRLKMEISLMKRPNKKLKRQKRKQIFFLRYQPKKLILKLIRKQQVGLLESRSKGM